jgi:hypothetical protein
VFLGNTHRYQPVVEPLWIALLTTTHPEPAKV